MLRSRPWLFLLAAAVAAGAYFLGQCAPASRPAAKYRTVQIDRGPLTQTVSANGTLNPVILVNVGTQVSGTIWKLYADFNDKVQQGQILAELDPRLLQAALDQSRAQVEQSRATLHERQAQAASAEATLRLMETNLANTQALRKRNFVSQNELDTAQKELDVARAELERTRAAVETARADLRRAEAMVRRDTTNLNYAVIRSPVSGVVVSRSVDLGQTVAANFQTPTLFQIAQDLKQMQIDTSMAEADIGGVRVGQKVRFTVDAFADETFEGKVKQIRLNPTIEQNVVTYNVVVAVQNPEERFLPGMTAFVTIEVAHKEDALRVPVAALRFLPEEKAEVTGLPPERRERGHTLYKLDGDRLVAVAVQRGLSSNRMVEVRGETLHEGDRVVVETIRPERQNGDGGRFRVRAF